MVYIQPPAQTYLYQKNINLEKRISPTRPSKLRSDDGRISKKELEEVLSSQEALGAAPTNRPVDFEATKMAIFSRKKDGSLLKLAISVGKL